MKKLIISAITAAALLFGFAGCSGDLHDDEKRPIDLSGGYYLVGSMNGWKNASAADVIAFEKTETAGSYNVPFSADAKEVAFAFIPTPGKWDGQIGGDKMVGGTLPANAKFEAKDNGNGGQNGTISGLEAKGKYKLTVTALDNGTLKIDCSSNVPPTPYYLDGYAVRSLDSGWNVTADNLLYNPLLNEGKGILTYKLDFVAKNASQQLAIARKDWTEGRWECSEAKSFAVGAEPIFLESGKEQHPTVTGLTVGNPYRIYVYTTPEQKVSMKVVGLTNVEVTPTVSVTGLPEALNGTTLYFTGDFNGWKEPSKDGSIECKVTGGSVSVTLPKVSKAFETGEAQEFSYQGKFASAGWTKPEITNDAGENISFKVTSDKHTLKGTFKTTKEKDGGTLYLCDWTVE